MKLISIFAVAAGGALGAVLRYLTGLLPFHDDMPFATLTVNLLGALAIGFIAGAAASGAFNKNQTLFFKTGVCGGFTTFSAFSLESLSLIENGRTGAALLYMFVSIAGCLLGVWLGTALGKILFGN